MHNPRLLDWTWRISVPTTVVWGDRDGIVRPEYGRGLAGRIPGARFELVEHAGHRPQAECPEDVARLVAKSAV
jgi:pimeloyl-ACP methyl ester carboxylesterase